MLHKTIYGVSIIFLLIVLTACSERVPSEIQSACKEAALINTFERKQEENNHLLPSTGLQPTGLISGLMVLGMELSIADQNAKALDASFLKSAGQTIEEIKHFDFSRAKRTDGKPFSDWKRNEGPVEIVVPHRESDNALTVKCELTKDNKGEYLFSYRVRPELFSGRTVEETLKLLSSADAVAQENKRLEAAAAEKVALQKKQEEEAAAARKLQEEKQAAQRQAQAEARALDEKEWAKAQQTGTDEGYHAYLNQPNHDVHSGEAKNKLAASAFERAQKVGTPEAYKQFLSEFPSSKPAADARNTLEQLLWVDANVVKTLASYREFVSLFPNGKFSDQAKIQIDEMSWNEAKENGSESAIQKYLSSFPSGRHVRDGEVSLDAIAWDNANKENVSSAYVSYARRFPRGKHIQDSRQAAILSILQEQHSKLQSIDIVGNTPWSGITVVNITPEVIAGLVQLGYTRPITGGVVISGVIPGYENKLFINIYPGDIIVESDRTPATDIATFLQSIRKRDGLWTTSTNMNTWQYTCISTKELNLTGGNVYAPNSFDRLPFKQISSSVTKSSSVQTASLPAPSTASSSYDSSATSQQVTEANNINTASLGNSHDTRTESVKSLILSYLRANENKEMDRVLSFYGDTVDYYSNGMVSKSYIRKDKEKYFTFCQKLSYSLADDLHITRSDDSERITLQFSYAFFIQSAKKNIRGTASNIWVIKNPNTSPQIISEKQTVIDRKESNS